MAANIVVNLEAANYCRIPVSFSVKMILLLDREIKFKTHSAYLTCLEFDHFFW